MLFDFIFSDLQHNPAFGLDKRGVGIEFPAKAGSLRPRADSGKDFDEDAERD
jgi:hypothetical protein